MMRRAKVGRSLHESRGTRACFDTRRARLSFLARAKAKDEPRG